MSHTNYVPDVQYLDSSTPIEEMIFLMKRDGAIFIRELVSPTDVDKAYEEIKPRLEQSQPWTGSFFPSMYTRISSLDINSFSSMFFTL